MKNYEQFIGKICTVLTNQTAFPFSNPKQHAEYFTGLVTQIDQYGILIKHMNTNTHAFYTFPIIGIIEEQVISKSDPNFEKIKEEVEQKKKPPALIPAPTINNNNFLSVEEMTQMAKKIVGNNK